MCFIFNIVVITVRYSSSLRAKNVEVAPYYYSVLYFNVNYLLLLPFLLCWLLLLRTTIWKYRGRLLQVTEQEAGDVKMDKKTIAYFRKMLEHERESITKRLGKDFKGSIDVSETSGKDEYDEASDESAISTVLWLRNRESNLLGKIEEALERIDSGEYGYCETCGELIGEARLKVRPFTNMCIHCKEIAERQSKQFAGEVTTTRRKASWVEMFNDEN
jgi:RNA polymerase-binding transcription factor